MDDVEADAVACLHCEDQGHVCDWCDQPPGECHCCDDREDMDEETAAGRWSRCTWCQGHA